MPRIGVLAVAAVAWLAMPVVAAIEYDGFSDTTGLTLNGDAGAVVTGDGTVLRVTGAAVGQTGSVFSTAVVNAQEFSAAFSFRIHDAGGVSGYGNDEAGADGLAFVVQSVDSTVGSSGGGIGYQGITQSVAVEFDTWLNYENADPSQSHVAIMVGGVVTHGEPAEYLAHVTGPELDDGDRWYAWVDYDGQTLAVRLSLSDVRPAAPLVARPVDVASILGQDTGYVGFTSGTGLSYAAHDVLSLRYTEYVPSEVLLTYDVVSGHLVLEPTGGALSGFVIHSPGGQFTGNAELPEGFVFNDSAADLIGAQFVGPDGQPLAGEHDFGPAAVDKAMLWDPQAGQWGHDWQLTYTLDGVEGTFAGQVVIQGMLPGDVDLDGDVDAWDVQLILAANSYGNGTGWLWADGDFDGDSDVDFDDIQMIFDHGLYGQAVEAPLLALVPEPHTLCVLLLAALPSLGRRGRGRRTSR